MQSVSAIQSSLTQGDTPEEIASDVDLVNHLNLVPTLLHVLCDLTGLRFAAVARVTNSTWTACVVKDDLGFGAVPGSQIEAQNTLCLEAKRANALIACDSTVVDPSYRDHPVVKRNNLGSFITTPIVLSGGQYFGNLCAHDENPARVTDPRIVATFKRFADLVGLQLDSEKTRRATEQSLVRAKTESSAREQAMAILAHDLRTPLQAILATGSLIERSVREPTLLSKAARIRTSVNRMSKLIDVVLDFSRGRLGGGVGVQIESAEDLGAALEVVVKEFQDGYASHQFITRIHVPQLVRCDLPRIQQVAANIIGNAVTYSDPTYPIKITAHIDEGMAVFSVWNAGAPIPENNFGNLFEPFWQNKGRTNKQGLGLGLYICSKIVSAHQGHIEVASGRDAGTTFTVKIPLR